MSVCLDLELQIREVVEKDQRTKSKVLFDYLAQTYGDRHQSSLITYRATLANTKGDIGISKYLRLMTDAFQGLKKLGRPVDD